MTGRILVFAGPTLRPSDRALYPGLCFRPPIGRGDILDLLAEAPAAIGIVDGWFDHRPAVGHAEIVAALALGIRVYGAASMGALRATELVPFGMVGVGRVYRALRAGRITGDAAVAVAHGPEELGFPPLSVSEVDVVATLDRLVALGRLDPARARRLACAAAARHHAGRTWIALAQDAEPDDPDPLARMLARGHVEVKRRDARALLAVMRRDIRRAPPPQFRPPPPAQTPSFTLRVAEADMRSRRRASA